MAIGTPVTGSTVLTSGVTSATVDITNATVGDFVFCAFAYGYTGLTFTFTGWTAVSLTNNSTSTGTISIWYRKKVSGDTTFTLSWPTTSAKGVIIWADWPGVDTTTGYEPAAMASAVRASAVTASVTGSATPTAADRWAAGFFWSSSSTTANKAITFTPDAAMTERADINNSAATSTRYAGLEVADTAGAVTQAAHTYTANSNFAEANGGGVLLYLIPAGGATVAGSAAASATAAATAAGAAVVRGSAAASATASASAAGMVVVPGTAAAASTATAAAASGVAAAASLTDPFDADSGLWTFTGSYVISGGVLDVTPALDAAGLAYAGVSSVATYDLRSSSVAVVFAQIASGSYATNTELQFGAGPNSDCVKFVYEDGLLYFQSYAGSVKTGRGSVAFDWATMKAWRLRHDGTNVTWETSPDGVQWTIRATVAATSLPSVAAGHVIVDAGYWDAAAPPGQHLQVDAVNPAVVTGPPAASGTWLLRLSDDFTGPKTAVDSTNGLYTLSSGGPTWRVWYPSYSSFLANPYGPHQNNVGTGDVYYDASGVSVASGVLSLTATHNTPNVDLAYTSGMIQSEPTITPTYGYAEARIKLPAADLSWPAFWMAGAASYEVNSDEFDQMENFGTPDYYTITTWRDGSGGVGGDLYAHHVPTDVTGWHVYGVEWTPTKLTFYLDGVQVAQDTNVLDVPQRPMYLLLNLSVQKGANTATYPATMQVDWVKFWQLPATAAPTSVCASTARGSAVAIAPAAATSTAAAAAVAAVVQPGTAVTTATAVATATGTVTARGSATGAAAAVATAAAAVLVPAAVAGAAAVTVAATASVLVPGAAAAASAAIATAAGVASGPGGAAATSATAATAAAAVLSVGVATAAAAAVAVASATVVVLGAAAASSGSSATAAGLAGGTGATAAALAATAATARATLAAAATATATTSAAATGRAVVVGTAASSAVAAATASGNPGSVAVAATVNVTTATATGVVAVQARVTAVAAASATATSLVILSELADIRISATPAPDSWSTGDQPDRWSASATPDSWATRPLERAP